MELVKQMGGKGVWIKWFTTKCCTNLPKTFEYFWGVFFEGAG